MAQQIGSSLTALMVSNKERSKQYYRDVLGFDVTDWWAVRDGLKGLALKLLQAKDLLSVRPNSPEQGATRAYDVYAYVENWAELDRLYDEFAGKGAIISGEPIVYPDGGPWKEFIVQDPDGYNLAFGGVDEHKAACFVHDHIDSVYLWVRDLDKSVDLYSRFMGLNKRDEDRQGPVHIFKLSSGMELILDSNGMSFIPIPEMGPSLFKLNTTDIEAACQHARDLGFQVVFGIVHYPKVSYFNVRDEDGNIITVSQSHPNNE
jgi:catechol 2,3-dioxygenase-like lactoylglutathione lyase family enzyme